MKLFKNLSAELKIFFNARQTHGQPELKNIFNSALV